MEAGKILNMVEDVFRDKCLIIDSIVGNDYSTMIALLNHLSIGSRGQFLRSSKRKLDEVMPVTSFLADPSHRVKVVAKHIFSIVNDDKAWQCGCTKADAIRLKKYWGCMITKNGNNFFE